MQQKQTLDLVVAEEDLVDGEPHTTGGAGGSGLVLIAYSTS